MKLLNLGCGNRFHPDWTNIDFVSTGEGVIAHNLLQGIPFEAGSFDAVYHSHVLEHFTRTDARIFIKECNRVLKAGGVLRVAIPDLERIVRCYLHQLEGALAGDETATLNYEWIMLEMYDQVVRNQTGGDMLKFFEQEEIKNENFVYERIGQEGRTLREMVKRAKEVSRAVPLAADAQKAYPPKPGIIGRALKLGTYKQKIRKVLFKDYLTFLQNEKERYKQQIKHLEIGRFRATGENHQWMYDRYSLGQLLMSSGFTGVEVKDAFSSSIPTWNTFELESKDGVVFKPDSLFMEAVKK